MAFTSQAFVIFLPVIFLLYWFVFKKSSRSQNILLLFASMIFYGWADWRFLFLIVGSAIFNFIVGIKIYNSSQDKIKLLYFWLGAIINLGILGFFKYFNFFYDNFVEVINLFGLNSNHSTLILILPLGISFFTFQTLGYLIDIYNEEIEPSIDFFAFSTYVLYFPKVIAGPIERAQKFLPQIKSARVFDYTLASDGLKQIAWGLFAKVVVADNCAPYVNQIFGSYQEQSSFVLLSGLFLYFIQIYADFSGYSNIALGVSKLFGIRLMINFATPFFSTNISEFWKRWHISLTSWLMNYVFTPLSFVLRRYKKKAIFLSILITFILVGFWHGANWTFIVFGLLNGLYFLPLVLKGSINSIATHNKNTISHLISKFFQMAGLFCLLTITIVFFRSDNLSQAFSYLYHIFVSDLYYVSDSVKAVMVLPIILIIPEWFQRKQEHALQFNNRKVPTIIRWLIYYVIFFLMVNYMGGQNSFIYARF